MDYKNILLEQRDNIAVLSLNRPNKLNAFTFSMMEEMIDALDALDADNNIHALIITGKGRAFCAGADLSSGQETFNPSFDDFAVQESDFRRDSGGILTLRMYKFLKPIVIACNGPAVGIGASMQLAADVRLASDQARFGFVFNNRGIVPDACSSWFLPKIVGISSALELTYSGRIIDASEALKLNLVSSIYDSENLLDNALDFAKNMVKNSAPVSIAVTRQMLWRSLEGSGPYDAHIVESKAIDSRGASEDAKEGVSSFLEKRAAEFKNKVSEDMPSFFPWWK
ncbi:MAG: crotonase/enoyl-CoA hydratase family protein [SAR86 cluster bacterium]|nr:crotonase/enoyl-CoA hydratase family protein [Gammaproteobacteria bacterium]MDO7561433.1 crotonase/enoyl-CoA hydratase family protein [SAR86 cluster bacterium]MDA9028063.1 crotonase/enoyl-CoA hydratase family protein [Gammaproteobacteria bacterium]MDA9917435.1 crotonase/enoyl-CoA hydratase family protein [Gammaproteobacteria bacterium]MDO7577435.1 crotonase/enoyl-CoA hydratase family protein [SAR86 cluster bacterium]